MILKNSVLQSTDEESPINAYESDRLNISKAILDKHVLQAGRFLSEKQFAANEHQGQLWNDLYVKYRNR